jgi:4-amino-4-deoxy-L-arabinose transferase-like glycosyltransferase
MGNNSTAFWIIAILLLGAILRLSIYNLAPLFMDTAFYASLGRAIADGDLLLQVNHVSDKPPLFFYLQAFFFYMFGVSESVAAIPSFLGGLLGMLIIYLLGRDLYDSFAGILAALLFALSPGSVSLSTVGYIDSFFMAVVMFSFWTMLHRHYYWTGLLIGIAFGMKQTVLSFGPFYLLWLLILEFHHHNRQEVLRSVTKSIVKMIPGFMTFFLPVLYWSLFLASDRLRVFKYITSFVSGGQETEFVGSYHERLTRLKGDMAEVIGLSWHWVIALMLLSMIIFLVKIFNQRRLQKPLQLNDKLHFGFNLFTLFFFFLLTFIARKYTGPHYVFPVFPFLILTASITLAQLTNVNSWSGKMVIPVNLKVSFLIVIVLGAVFIPASKRIKQIGEGSINVPYQGAREVVKELKPYITQENSFLFEQSLGWMLRYYLFGEQYRRQHYDYEDHDLANMKAFISQEPYTNFYVLFDRAKQIDIPRMSSFLAPEYSMNAIFQSPGGNFLFYKINPVLSKFQNYEQNLPERWGSEWNAWWKDILESRWAEAKNITIKSKLDNSGKHIEVNLFAEQVPFKELVTAEMRISIKSPKPNIHLSKFYNWPVFDEHLGITMQLLVDGDTMEKTILDRFQQVENIEVHTDQSLTNFQVYGKLGERELEVDTDFHLVLERDFIRVVVNRFLLNGFDLTWLTNLFKNHPVPSLKLNKYHPMDLELNNIKQQNGQIVLNYHTTTRIKHE